jgi:hypothetical protein
MTMTGNRVHIERRDAASFNNGLLVAYDVVIAADGTVSGTGRILPACASFPIRATVACSGTSTAIVPPPSNTSLGCGLGARWEVSESGYAGTWVRRGNTSTFDATWQRGSERGTSTLTMSLSGNRVNIQRQDAANFSGGGRYVYDGTIGADGTFSGTNRNVVSGAAYPISGTVRCGDVAAQPPSPPPASADPGRTLVVVYPGVCVAIWTRTQPGIYDAVTVCQGPGNASFREVLTVESYDGRSVVISRPNYGRYRGTLSADHKTITGTCNWPGCTSGIGWTAYVDLDWSNSPPLK